jgi:hypothetical protein
MSQNLISMVLADEQIAATTTALDQLKTVLSALISLSPADRKTLKRMGPKSESFVRQALSMLQQNPQVVPPSIDVAGGHADLVAVERSRSILRSAGTHHARCDLIVVFTERSPP